MRRFCAPLALEGEGSAVLPLRYAERPNCNLVAAKLVHSGLESLLDSRHSRGMPRRNTRNRRLPGIYHVYNRARSGGAMFMDDADRNYFLDLFKRYLSLSDYPGARNQRFPSLRLKVRLITFALMTTRRHGTKGPMFNGEYRADHKPDHRSQLTAIAYVHDNHGPDCRCKHCGHHYFIADSVDTPSWIGAQGALDLSGGRSSYLRYRQARGALSEIAT